MMQEYKKLRDALSTIREECNAHTYCSDCPLSISNYVCGVTGQNHSNINGGYKTKPGKWNLPPVKLIAKMEE